MRRHWHFMTIACALVSASAAAGCATELNPTGSSGSGGASMGAGGMSGTGGDPTTTAAGTGGTGGQMLPPGTCAKSSDCTAMNDVCNVGTCIDGKCEKLLAHQGEPCDDGLFCTDNDSCQPGGTQNGVPFGTCMGGGPKDCTPASNCQVGSCDEDNDTCTAIAANDGATCDDNNSCTLDGTCVSGQCLGAPLKNCTIYDSECAIGVCDPMTGCKPAPKNDGAACTLGSANPCATGQCMQGQCAAVPANTGNACDDGQWCTLNDHCDNAQCVGDPRPCPSPGGCYTGSCDDLVDACVVVPGNDGATCDDQNSCTSNTVCQNGVCAGGMATNEGMSCDDRAFCTTGEVCTVGQCGASGGLKIYFADDFRDSSKGWVMGPDWQIGPTQASPLGFGSTTDPATDHSPTADNGVAGVIIGGNASTLTHPMYYLESPTFDTSAATGQVILSFYRWLNSDSTPYMQNTIDVWNGLSWVNIWTSSTQGIYDAPPVGQGWKLIQHDLTIYKNANMRIRFGYKVGSSGANIVGQWNIDDLAVASGPCQ